ncbi:MAG TPA: hypothetical protein VK982_00670 [Bacteroidales bacterium]|nr:hypothetical protein [Bacteroidales bacterium]
MNAYKLFLLFCISILISCSEEELSETSPFILLKTGNEFSQSGDSIPVGGQLKFGISAVGDGVAITNFTIKRITEDETITELDKGMYVLSGGLDTTVTFVKSSAETEKWYFLIMNAHRDTASITTTIYKGKGSAYGRINYFPSIEIGYQNNEILPNYLDLNTGKVYNRTSITGNESLIDLVSYYYLSSGTSSPTLSCPSYPSAREFYPEINNWSVQNSVLYDYYTTDNNLISIETFDNAQNDSLLVNAFKPSSTSGNCKFCYTGKIIPFKTGQGKYGMIKVINADEINTGSIEIAVKIQK